MITDDDVRVAFQDFGSGPPVVFSQNVFGHLEGYWEFETLRRLYERLMANVRVLIFDHRGSGMSDGFVESPSLDDRILDIKAVMDAAEVEKASLLGYDVGAQVAVGFAVAHPKRVDRLVLTNARVGVSAYRQADELNPEAEITGPLSGSENALQDLDNIGIKVDESLTEFSPSIVDDELLAAPRFQAKVGSRDAYRRQIDSVAVLDIANIAHQVQAPTLVTHTRDNRFIHVGYARLLADLIPDSTLIEFEGDDHVLFVADNWREITDEFITFITQSGVAIPVRRRFSVVLFTDIVGSTRAALTSGDDRWRQRLDAHDRIVSRAVGDHAGSLIKNTGDGILATFDAPSQAVEAALRIRGELATSNIPIRAGIHAGEVEIRGDDVSGAVVNLAARVEQAAEDGDIYATSTIKDMLIGSTYNFESVGSHELKGFDGDWPLFKIVHTSPRP